MKASAGSNSLTGQTLDAPGIPKRFQNYVNVIEHCGGSIGQEPGLVLKVLQDNEKTGNTAIENDYTQGQDN
jgi:hypothetical protein